ncbi:hypothetical protein C5167_007824 [Papaver somniferum]|nr:hypothetical protein C5167_007824 [Papaver somniferum]
MSLKGNHDCVLGDYLDVDDMGGIIQAKLANYVHHQEQQQLAPLRF